MAVDLAALWRRIDADFPGRPRERDRAWLEGVREWARAGDLLSYILYVHGHEHADVRSFCFSRHGLAMAEHMEGSRHTLIAAHPESGKGLALDTPLPAPGGWSTMGDLAVGDELFSVDGAVTKVVFVSEVHNRPCYRVTFSDGATIICDDQHRWLTRTRVPQHGMSVKSMPEITERVLTIEGRPNHGVPVARALDLPPQLLPLDPYVLGVWLGDGATLSGLITNVDEDVWDSIQALGYSVGPSISTGGRAPSRTVYGLAVTLRNMGLRGNKRIPTRYLRASVAQRQALLEGLMDTDGHCTKKGRCEFTSISEGLANDVLELLRSLGHKARIYEGRAVLNGVDHGPKYRVDFVPRRPVFRLQRKKARQLVDVPNDRDRWLTITAADQVDSVPTRCIQVEHPSHLFVAGRNMVLTHNTLAHRSELEQWIGIQTERAFADPDATVPSAAYIMGTLENQAEPQVLFMRETIEKSRRYRELFPHARPDKKAQWEKGKFFLARPPGRTRPEPTLIAMGCEGDIQGGRYGKITVDDPISQQDAKSDKIVRDRVAWILGTLERRLLQEGTLRYGFTRWHERDAFRPLSRICLTLVMPVYGFWEKHPEYNYQAETLWPEKWPRERVEAERNKLIDAGFAYLFNLVWLCDPLTAVGSVIKRAWFHYGPNPLREAAKEVPV